MKLAIGRGILTTLLSELFGLTVWSLVGPNQPIDLLMSYTRLSSLEWATKILVWLGTLVVGVMSGRLKAPLWLLVLGVFFVPWTELAVYVIHMDIIGDPPLYFLWLVPLCTSSVAALPTLLYLRSARQIKHQ
jgi:hypothetical protein